MSNEWYDSLPNPDDDFFPPSQDSGPVNTRKLEERVARLEELLRVYTENAGDEGRRTADGLGVLSEEARLNTFRNLITNGDFSNPTWSGVGVPPSWVKVGNPTIISSTAPAGSLGNAVNILTVGAANWGIQQTVTLAGGKTYTLDFKWKPSLTNTTLKVSLTSNGTVPIAQTHVCNLTNTNMINTWDQTPINPEQISFEVDDDTTFIIIGFYSQSAAQHLFDLADVALWEGSGSHPYVKKILDESTGAEVNSVLLGRERNYSSQIWRDSVKETNDILAARVFGA